jgi:type VI secretion system protein ImpM
MIPSVDEVGRYFPLTIAHQGACAPWAAYLDGQEWYQTVAKLALTALDEQTSYTQLIKQLEALPCPAFSAAPEYSTQTVTMNAHANQAFTSTPADTPQQLANNVLHKAYTGLLGNYSLWWTEGSEHVEPSLLLSANLPEAGQFAAMLDGDWRQWNWAKEDIINHDNP